MKKRFQSIVGLLIICMSLSSLVACGENVTKEDVSKQVDTIYSEIPQSFTRVMAETKPYPELEALIASTFQIPKEDFATTKYYYNYVDLNQDGVEDVFAIVMGPYTSGTGGSTAMIAYPNKDGLQLNQVLTLVNPPVLVSDTYTNGVKELIVYQSGGGGESGFVRLTCSDGFYQEVNAGMKLESLDGISGDALIANDVLDDIEKGKALYLKK